MVSQPLSAPARHRCYATVLWWDLAGSGQTLESLQRELPEPTEPAGARTARWVADRARNRWGRVLLWRAEPGRPCGGGATELIGYRPTDCWSFELEAGQDGGGWDAGE